MVYPTNSKEKYTEAVDEWKSCICQIDKFDGYLVKLREYGFTLITGITTATGFLGTKNESAIIQVGVVLVTAFLLWVLWRVDQYYQDLVFGTVVTGEILEKKCKRGLINTMSSYAWKNNRRRSSKLVIIYLAFLGALLAIGFIFLWNATDPAQTDDGSDDDGSLEASFYIKPVQMETDQEGSVTMINDHIINFLTSPLFWLLIAGFGLVASHISYSYLTVEKKRSNKYDGLYERLAAYDKGRANQRNSRESLSHEMRDIRNNIKEIEMTIEDTKKDLEDMSNLGRSGGTTEVKIKRDKLVSLERDLARQRGLLGEQEAAEEEMEEKDLDILQDDVKKLIMSD
jgi:hypothetical protein